MKIVILSVAMLHNMILIAAAEPIMTKLPFRISKFIEEAHTTILARTIAKAEKDLTLNASGKEILHLYKQFHSDITEEVLRNPDLLDRSNEMLAKTLAEPSVRSRLTELQTATVHRYRIELWKAIHVQTHWLLTHEVKEIKTKPNYFLTLLRNQKTEDATDSCTCESSSDAQRLPNLAAAMLTVVRMLEFNYQEDPDSCAALLEEYLAYCCPRA